METAERDSKKLGSNGDLVMIPPSPSPHSVVHTPVTPLVPQVLLGHAIAVEKPTWLRNVAIRTQCVGTKVCKTKKSARNQHLKVRPTALHILRGRTVSKSIRQPKSHSMILSMG